MNPELAQILAQGCRQLGVAEDAAVQGALLDYLAMLQKWNRAYNLTAVRDPLEMVRRHLLDSLAIVPHVPRGRLIDVGTGAGLPGIPLAIVYPEQEIHLLDSNVKKTRFLFQVKTALRLDNMTVHHARVEEFHDGGVYDAVLSRAFASLSDMVTGCRHLLAADGSFLAMKGVFPEAELQAVQDQCELRASHPLKVPGLDAERHLLELVPRDSGGH
ncbi:16S rRNA (guanine(527)-N(7))-methyltransferase RsmG [Haliea sp. E17]|uniref:16S rRNA (guanine(527)-N(7))-methyltransferase RsmG n=1 Tax=Haliea sp. E17 TaxID=3401576 RepID=UPI003AB097BD